MTAKPAVLLLIDYQKGFEAIAAGAHRNNPEAEANALRLIQAWRDARWPIIHVRHDSTDPGSPFRPGEPGNAPMSFAIEEPGDIVVRKQVSSAFIGTDLVGRLEALGRPDVVVAGISTDHCVSTTVRMGANLGFRMILAADGCFTFQREDAEGNVLSADEVHRAAIASLKGEFAEIVPSAVLVGRALSAA